MRTVQSARRSTGGKATRVDRSARMDFDAPALSSITEGNHLSAQMDIHLDFDAPSSPPSISGGNQVPKTDDLSDDVSMIPWVCTLLIVPHSSGATYALTEAA